MIQVFCSERGSGKTKKLINLANDNLEDAKGDSVFIDDDNRTMLSLNRKIRFISTEEFTLKDYESFYGFLCGLISENYDIENIYVDGLSNIVRGNELNGAELLFEKMKNLSRRFGVKFFINLNHNCNDVPEFIRQYSYSYS
ncbi:MULTISPECIES: hypothetical protein [Clostridium]|uniref:Uncharacterized protein n=1 Tax=Clostridium paridis TaxID=2803863 RepID=A0A937FIW3_9CLOT|nr:MULTISPECIES: hypothetical protein [Clostridium]MBL4933940.1 hypothetical protein [Clostridium paridis]